MSCVKLLTCGVVCGRKLCRMDRNVLRGMLEGGWNGGILSRILVYPLLSDFLAILTEILQLYLPMSGNSEKQEFDCCWHRVLTVHRLPNMPVKCPTLYHRHDRRVVGLTPQNVLHGD